MFMLEGGYDLRALGESVVDSMLGTLGETPVGLLNSDLILDEPLGEVETLLRNAKAIHGL